MIHKLFIIAFLICSSNMSFAQGQEIPASDWEVPVKFDKETHDYGNLKHEADGSCVFTFTNTGKEPIMISNAQASCGCTVPEYSKEPIKSGKTGTIKVTYDTKRVGAINKSVTITFENVSKTKSGNKILTIKGNVEDSHENHDGHNH